MLSSEFNQEMGALIRSLERRVRNDPALLHDDGALNALGHIEDAIVALVVLHMKLQKVAGNVG